MLIDSSKSKIKQFETEMEIQGELWEFLKESNDRDYCCMYKHFDIKDGSCLCQDSPFFCCFVGLDYTCDKWVLEKEKQK